MKSQDDMRRRHPGGAAAAEYSSEPKNKTTTGNVRNVSWVISFYETLSPLMSI